MIRVVPYSPIVRTKTKIDPITIPGRLREDDLPEPLEPVRAEVARRLQRAPSTWASMKKIGVIMKRM